MKCLGLDPELPVAGGWLPAKGAAIIHDDTDKLFGRCHIYVVRAVTGLPGEGVTNLAAYLRAYPYWNEDGPALRGLFEVPFHHWTHVARVRHIRYFRPDRGWLAHPFAAPVNVLQTTTGPLAWQLSLPGACLVNARGFITP